jgi:hypothetical protein
MSIERITSDTAYRPRWTDNTVHAEYAAWLAAHARYYG